MIMAPGTWPSRLAALGILLLLLFASYRFLAAPALSLHALNDQRAAQMGELLERYRALAASREGFAERLAEVEGRDEAASGYWAGPSEALATARMQDRVADAIETHGGEVLSVQIIRTEGADEGTAARRAELGLRLSATIGSLGAIVHDMEAATPYLFIDRLAITPDRLSRQRSEDAGYAPELDVRLNVFGYLEPTESAPPADREGRG